MEPFTVIFVDHNDSSDLWQFFECHADDADHAEEQCADAYPACEILWVNVGHGHASQTMDGDAA